MPLYFRTRPSGFGSTIQALEQPLATHGDAILGFGISNIPAGRMS